MKAIGSINIDGVKKIKSGKVREIFELGENLLIVTTDRISAFDFVLDSLIPLKGAILNKISVFWFEYLKDMIKNHLVETDVNAFPDILKTKKEIIGGRSVLVKKVDIFPIECVVRGYITGSGWSDYKKTGSIADIGLPKGLKESQKLSEPIFTPSTKAESGHDMPITLKDAKNAHGSDVVEFLKEKSIELYVKAADFAKEKGIIIADTKFEFGRLGQEIILADEVLTPDSSRFWPLEDYEVGRSQNSFDKQYVRDYLLSTDWDRRSNPPALPEQIIKKTTERYKKAYEILLGKDFKV